VAYHIGDDMVDKRYSSVRRRFEVLLVRWVAWGVPLWPRWMVILLGRGLGVLAWLVPGRHRRVADSNLLAILGGETSASERRRICIRHLQVQATTILDLFWFMRNTEARLARWVDAGETLREIESVRPCLLITAHFGNWEVLGLRVAQEAGSLVSVARPLKNVQVDELLNRYRQRMGQRVVARRGALRSLVKALRGGEHVALVMDQNTLPSEGGAFVPFLGLKAPVSRATGTLARVGRCAVMVGGAVLQRDGRYRVVTYPALRSDLERMSEESINRYVVESLEDMIRTYPGQWLWSYKRWKYWVDEADAGRYPSYARISPELMDPVAGQ
jgi:KDO2-lipid IV(A) lauroyltransferase